MNAVGSYPTFSPLPCGQRTPIGRSVFCGTGRHRFGWTPILTTPVNDQIMPRRYLAARPWSPDFPR